NETITQRVPVFQRPPKHDGRAPRQQSDEHGTRKELAPLSLDIQELAYLCGYPNGRGYLLLAIGVHPTRLLYNVRPVPCRDYDDRWPLKCMLWRAIFHLDGFSTSFYLLQHLSLRTAAAGTNTDLAGMRPPVTTARK